MKHITKTLVLASAMAAIAGAAQADTARVALVVDWINDGRVTPSAGN